MADLTMPTAQPGLRRSQSRMVVSCRAQLAGETVHPFIELDETVHKVCK